MPEEYTKTLIRLTPEQYETLRRLSFDTKTPIAEHIRRAVDEYLAKEKRGQ